MDFVRYPSGETLVGSNPTPLIIFLHIFLFKLLGIFGG
jgi:hypothetical protein